MSQQSGGTNPKQVIIALIAGLLVPVIAIILIVQLILSIEKGQIDKDRPGMSEKAVAARLAPVGQVAVIDANAPRVEKPGEQVVTEVCASCHVSGALGAPKVGSNADWAPRIKQGFDTMVKNAIDGIRQMPPKGGNPDLSDIEVARAVAVMGNKSGGNFTEPAAPAAAPTAVAGANTAVPATGATPPADSSAAATTAAPSAGAVASSAPATGSATAPATPVPATPAPATPTPATPAPAAAAPAASAAKGKSIYDASCAACHASGVAGAPKLGDKAAWAPRIKAGNSTLYTSAIKGKNAMPPKGGNAALSDDDVKAAVDYMVAQSK